MVVDAEAPLLLLLLLLAVLLALPPAGEAGVFFENPCGFFDCQFQVSLHMSKRVSLDFHPSNFSALSQVA